MLQMIEHSLAYIGNEIYQFLWDELLETFNDRHLTFYR